MRKLLAATAALITLTCTAANADIIFLNQVDIGAQGFGNAPRMLTLQDTGNESGFVTPVNVVHGGAIPGADKSTTPQLAFLGWASGADVLIAFNADTANTGITIDTLILTIYNGSSPVGSFSLAAPITFSQAQVANEQGNGRGVFEFGLNLTQQAQFDSIVAQAGSGLFFAGLNSTLGCGTGINTSASCIGTNDGPDTYLGVVNPAHAVPGPIAGAGIPGMIIACLGLIGLARRRRRA